MKMKILNILGLAIGFSAVATLTFFLIKSPYKCIIPFEPDMWVRIPEIFMGIFALIILGKIIMEKTKWQN